MDHLGFPQLKGEAHGYQEERQSDWRLLDRPTDQQVNRSASLDIGLKDECRWFAYWGDESGSQYDIFFESWICDPILWPYRRFGFS